MLKERFRSPMNKSFVNFAAEGSPTCHHNQRRRRCQRKSGRPRAVSLPGLWHSVGRKVCEKLERERDLVKLKHQLSNVQKANEMAKRDTSPSNGETKPLQDIQGGRDAKNVQDTQMLKTRWMLKTHSVLQARRMFKNCERPLFRPPNRPNCHAHAFSSAQELYRASVYSNNSEAGGSRLVESEQCLSLSSSNSPSLLPYTYSLIILGAQSGQGVFIHLHLFQHSLPQCSHCDHYLPVKDQVRP
ncbi:hypothetical protein JOM56_005143 [Amanita muscaria]